MASSSTEQLLSSLSLLLLLLSCSYSQTQARESKFFSKAIHIHSTAKNVEEMKPPSPVPPPEYVPVDSPTPAPAPNPAVTAPVTAPVPSETVTGYGLYGHGSGMLPPEKETVSTPTTIPPSSYRSEATQSGANDNNFENEMLAEELNGESTEEEEYSNNNNKNYYYFNNNNKENVYSNNYNLYGGSTSTKNNGYYESYRSSVDSSNGHYYPNNYNAIERQGMSDTRFLENGKYYYHVNRGDDQNAFEQADEKQSYTTASEGSDESETNRHDPNKSKYEFNTMEEYYQSQGYHLNNPEAYIPWNNGSDRDWGRED